MGNISKKQIEYNFNGFHIAFVYDHQCISQYSQNIELDQQQQQLFEQLLKYVKNSENVQYTSQQKSFILDSHNKALQELIMDKVNLNSTLQELSNFSNLIDEFPKVQLQFVISILGKQYLQLIHQITQNVDLNEDFLKQDQLKILLNSISNLFNSWLSNDLNAKFASIEIFTFTFGENTMNMSEVLINLLLKYSSFSKETWNFIKIALWNQIEFLPQLIQVLERRSQQFDYSCIFYPIICLIEQSDNLEQILCLIEFLSNLVEAAPEIQRVSFKESLFIMGIDLVLQEVEKKLNLLQTNEEQRSLIEQIKNNFQAMNELMDCNFSNQNIRNSINFRQSLIRSNSKQQFSQNNRISVGKVILEQCYLPEKLIDQLHELLLKIQKSETVKETIDYLKLYNKQAQSLGYNIFTKILHEISEQMDSSHLNKSEVNIEKNILQNKIANLESEILNLNKDIRTLQTYTKLDLQEFKNQFKSLQAQIKQARVIAAKSKQEREWKNLYKQQSIEFNTLKESFETLLQSQSKNENSKVYIQQISEMKKQFKFTTYVLRALNKKQSQKIIEPPQIHSCVTINQEQEEQSLSQGNKQINLPRPPPPPPPPLGRGIKQIGRKRRQANQKMKVIQWSNVTEQGSQNTIFQNMNDHQVPLNYDELELLFSQQNNQSKISTKNHIKASIVIPKKLSLLSQDRQKNVELVLVTLKISIASIVDAIWNMNYKILDYKIIERLISILPTEIEEPKYQDQIENIEEYTLPDIYFHEICKIPAYKSRIYSLRTIHTFQQDNLLVKLKNTNVNLKKIKENESIKGFFMYILSVTNFLNTSINKDSFGFKLSEFKKLIEIKSNVIGQEQQINLLQYILKIKDYDESLDQDISESRNIADLTKLTKQQISEDLKQIQQDYKNLTIAINSQSDRDKDNAKSCLQTYLDGLLNYEKQCSEQYQITLMLFKEITKYFCEEPEKYDIDIFFIQYFDMINLIKQAKYSNLQLRKEDIHQSQLKQMDTKNSERLSLKKMYQSENIQQPSQIILEIQQKQSIKQQIAQIQQRSLKSLIELKKQLKQQKL